MTLELSGGVLVLDGGEQRPYGESDERVLAGLTQRYYEAWGVTRRPEELVTIGQELWRWLRGQQGWTDDLDEVQFLEVRARREPGRVLIEAPWELLHDGSVFLVKQRQRLCPVRRVLRRRSHSALVRPPSDTALTVLFMAAAPEGQQALRYEDEEVGILDATEPLELDLVVEETGTARELAAHRSRVAPVDVLHLSCHGEAPKEGEPLLLLENEFGDPAPTTADMLARELGGEALQRLGLCFLSACETARASATVPSLSVALLGENVPAVLGWSGPVRDREASHLAAALYRFLSQGSSLRSALRDARRELLAEAQSSDDWHLARLYLGPSAPEGPLASTTARERFKRDHGEREFLDARGEVPVAARSSFVGRRREVQRALRFLRGDEKPGLLITGVGQQGKSSLAARLLRRLGDEKLVPAVCHGEAAFTAPRIYHTVRNALGLDSQDPERWPAERVGPQGGAELQQALFEVMTDAALPGLVLVLDDFEKILDQAQTPIVIQRSADVDHVATMRHLLRAFAQANTHGTRSRLIVTSRYGFALNDFDGKELVSKVMHELALPGMRPEAARKLRSATAPKLDSVLRDRAIELGYGNPGLTDRLLTLVKHDTEAAKRALEQIAAQEVDRLDDDTLRAFFEKVVLEKLVGLLPQDQRQLLRASTLFDVAIPVEVGRQLAEVCVVDPKEGPDRLLALGLWEEQPDPTDPQRPAFAANTLVSQLLEAGQIEQIMRGLGMPVPSAPSEKETAE